MMTGTTLGHYNILRLLGKGGMGEVYLAEDTRLKRDVAIKVLPESVREDSERLKRFSREAEAAAKLKHPNIATIYALESFDNIPVIVMEYVEGEPLSAHIPADGMTLETFFTTFIPLADALVHAHDQGRIHRDLKPGNIMITPEGIPKILDFGLARIVSAHADSLPMDSEAPTITIKSDEGVTPLSLTQEKVFLGTPAYMSPEQIDSKSVDPRSDLFSLGVVMYEAITGQRPFQGDTIESIIGRILEGEAVPVTTLKPITPYTLWVVLRQCLKKNREERIQAARAFKAALMDVQQEVRAGTRLVDVSVVEPKNDPPLRKFQFTVRIGESLQNLGEGPLISPDGTMMAYINKGQLWLRELNQLMPHPIPGSEGAYFPFWAPGSDFIGFIKQTSVYKVSTRWGTPMKLCELPHVHNKVTTKLAWGLESIIFEHPHNGELYEVSPQGGATQPFRKPDGGRAETALKSPSFFPDGKMMMYGVAMADGSMELHILKHPSASPVRIPIGLEGRVWHLRPVYSPTGHILYQLTPGSNPGIWAIPFSLQRLTATGVPFLVAPDGWIPSVASDGTLLYSLPQRHQQQLAWIDRTGQVEELVGQPQAQVIDPVISPDSSKMAFTLFGSDEKATRNHHTWIYDTKRQIRTPLADSFRSTSEPAWHPSGNKVALVGSIDHSNGDIFVASADGTGTIQPLITSIGDNWNPAWSPDGKYLVYHVLNPDSGRREIWCASIIEEDGILRQDGDPTLFLKTPFDNGFPQISPDGRYLAYQSNESGEYEIYVRPFTKGDGRWQVSVNGGVQPKWSSQSNELFYVHESTLFAVPVETVAEFRYELPRPLFTEEQTGIILWWLERANVFRARYDPSVDGKKFAVVLDIEGAEISCVVVQNWIKEFEGQS